MVAWAGSRALDLFAHLGGLLLLVTLYTLIVLSVGSSVEETRMVLSILPLVAALPGFEFSAFLSARPEVARRTAVALAALGAGLILLALIWDPVRGLPFAFSLRQVVLVAFGAGLVLQGWAFRGQAAVSLVPREAHGPGPLPGTRVQDRG